MSLGHYKHTEGCGRGVWAVFALEVKQGSNRLFLPNQNQLFNLQVREAGGGCPSASAYASSRIMEYEGPSPGGRWISCFSLCRMKPDDGWDQSEALDPGEATLGQGADRLHPAWLTDVLPEWLWVTSHPIKNGEGGMQKEKELCFKPSITFEPYNCSWGQTQRAFSSPISFVIQ